MSVCSKGKYWSPLPSRPGGIALPSSGRAMGKAFSEEKCFMPRMPRPIKVSAPKAEL